MKKVEEYRGESQGDDKHEVSGRREGLLGVGEH